jgi:hypothetical protein
MALFQYFGWVGSLLLVALFAANWFFSSPIAAAPASDVPLNQGINIRIHTEHKWPERVVFDSTSSMLEPEAKANTETEIGGSEMPAQAERQLLSPRCRLCPSSRAFDRPAPAASPQSGRPRRLWKTRHLKIAHVK